MSEISEPLHDATSNAPLELSALLPGLIKTIKRNGKIVRYDENKIKIAKIRQFIKK